MGESEKSVPLLETFQGLIIEAKQELDDVRNNLAMAEEELKKSMKDNHDLERKIGLMEDRHKQKMEEFRDELLTTKLQCEDKLKNHHRDRERHDIQVKLAKDECELIKENMRQNQIKFVEMSKTIKMLEKNLSSEKSQNEAQESRLFKVNERIEEVNLTQATLARTLNELELSMNDLTTVGCEFQTAIALRDKTIQRMSLKNEELNKKIFSLEVELKKKDQEIIEVEANESQKVEDNSLVTEKQILEDKVASLSNENQSLRAQIDLANQASSNYQQLFESWSQDLAKIEERWKCGELEAKHALNEVLSHLKTADKCSFASEDSPSMYSCQLEGS